MQKQVHKIALLGAALVAAPAMADGLTERQTDEVRAIVSEVLADANNRSSFLQGTSAGIEDGQVVLRDGEGNHELKINGQVQFRYILNDQNPQGLTPSGTGDTVEDGFQAARTELGFAGKVGDFGYHVRLQGNRDGGNVSFEEANISYALTDDLTVVAGSMKAPITRGYLIDSSRQVAVERSTLSTMFGGGRVDGAALAWNTDQLRVVVALNDGANTAFSEFYEPVTPPPENADWAVTARGEWLVFGEWDAVADNFGQQDQALALGAAVHSEEADGPGVDDTDGFAIYTVDAVYKMSNLGLAAAFYGIQDGGKFKDGDDTAFGLELEVDYVIDGTDLDVFGRVELGDENLADMMLLTAGVNYHFSKQVKATADVVWLNNYNAVDDTLTTDVDEGNPVGALGGLASGSAEGDAALRLQVQVLF